MPQVSLSFSFSLLLCLGRVDTLVHSHRGGETTKMDTLTGAPFRSEDCQLKFGSYGITQWLIEIGMLQVQLSCFGSFRYS